MSVMIESPDGARAAQAIDVLWVEDDRKMVAAHATTLRRHDIGVTHVATALAARESATARRFDLVVLDLQLPDTPGLLLLKELRAVGISMRVLVLTGYPSDATAFEARHFGVIGYLRKPIDPGDLAGRIRECASLSDGDIISARPNDETPVAFGVPLDVSALAVFVNQQEFIEATAEGDARVAGDVAELLGPRLCSMLADRQTGVPAFRAAQGSLRILMTRPDRPLLVTLALMRTILEEAAGFPRGATQAPAHGLLEALSDSRAAWAQEARAHCSRLQIDRYVLNVLMRHVFGMDLTEYQRLSRMQAAIWELAETNEHSAQIAHHLGWDHATHFTRAFHDQFGLTPTQFRELLRR
jgi:ActR/RegA family two-component response regulator/AraC-like DNA-binding protein